MNPADLLLFGGAVATLLLGAAHDVQTRRIPNALTFGSAALGLLVNLALKHGSGAGLSVEGWLAGVGILLLPFIARGVGGGDVKLLAAVGAWNGPAYVVQCLFWAALAGSVVALGMLVIHGQLPRALRTIASRAVHLAVVLVAMFFPSVIRVAALWLRQLSDGDAPAISTRLTIPFGPALALGGVAATVLSFT